MARTLKPNSQGSQFFIVTGSTASVALDQARTYVIFGNVVQGMDVVDKIAAMPNSGDPGQSGSRPRGHGQRHDQGTLTGATQTVTEC